MFNVLITSEGTAWETDQRMSMPKDRFKEHSGDESAVLSIDNSDHIKSLEKVQSLLMYENISNGPNIEVVRVGILRDIRVETGMLSFRFNETGRIERIKIKELQYRLQISDWEWNRTHWAVKDGDIPQDVFANMVPTLKKYDIVLSFAGEDRAYVEEVAGFLEQNGVSVFYDKYEVATLWGKNLTEHFDTVFRKLGRYCVMFISHHYANKMWPRHERRSALARALQERFEYILPARFDSSEIEGITPAIGYLDLKEFVPEQLGGVILQKLGRR